LKGKPVLNVSLLRFFFGRRQLLFEFPRILLLSSTALALIVAHSRQALKILPRSQVLVSWS
jgi:hypothetical protein